MILLLPGASLLLGALLFGPVDGAIVDTDHDGLPDGFEQSILIRFVPTFHISESDCDVAPAQFRPGLSTPTLQARDGTIYGQVFSVPAGTGTPSHDLEVHYYHLWNRDCGYPGHALDSESVSVLLRANSAGLEAGNWRAVYWYAAAHENTLCDVSNGATAAALNAVDRGPDVWVSKDKHASFLDKRLCSGGCGEDRCDPAIILQVSNLINIGEPGASMNGADWINAAAWPLAAKMHPDFTESLVQRMPDGQAIPLPARDVAKGVRTTLKVAGDTYSSLATANAETAAGLETGRKNTALGLSAATHVVSAAMRRARKFVNPAASSAK